jgi:hypothetical protein
MRAILLGGLSLLSFVVACQGTTVTGATTGTTTGTGATGGGTTTTGTGGGGGCITPTVGEACSASSPPACQPFDPCCAGYEWSCDTTTGTWQQLGLGCACQPAPTPFYCGPGASVECVPGHYCLITPPALDGGGPSSDGGPPDAGGASYTCVPIPTSCAEPDCGCIQQAAASEDPACGLDGGATCSQSASSQGVTVDCTGG